MPRRRGKRGDGTVGFDRRDQCWVARYPLGIIDGKRRYLKARAPTEDEAYEALDRLRRQAGGDATITTRTTLDQYLDGWLASHGPTVRASTRRSYEGHVAHHIAPLLGGIRVQRLRPEDVDRLVADRLRSGLSPATVVRIVTTLRIALGRAVKRRILPDNVAALASLPRVEQRLVEPMTEAQAARIVEVTSGTWLGPIVTLILGSGLRVGEACGLDWGDVDIAGRFVVVRVTKTRQRAVPISDDAAEALEAHRRTAKRTGPREPVFTMERPPRKGDDRMRPQSVTHALPRVLEAAGLPRRTPHELRHGAATLMVAQGVHMRVIAEQLGHRDGGALAARVYAHVVPAQQVAAVRLLNRRREA